MSSRFIPIGTRFDGPYGQFYLLQEDLYWEDVIYPRHFIAGGGAPKPSMHVQIEPWLIEAIRNYFYRMPAND